MSLCIDNIRLVRDGKPDATTSSVVVEDGRFVAVGDSVDRCEQHVDGQGQWLLPGLIDLNCHLREPGAERRGRIATETRAAAHGGFTTVCAAPDTSPVNDSGAVTNLIRDLAESQGVVRVLPVGAMTRGLGGEQLSDMAGLLSAGCVALGSGGRPTANSRVLRRCMAYAHTFGLTLFVQPENASLSAGGCAHDGVLAARLGLPGIPEVSETTAVSELLLLAEETGARLHIGPLSCARSLQLLESARQGGLRVTAEVAIHHLVHTDARIDGYDSTYHCRPPLRSEEDRQALLAGVESGLVDAITSQHRPQDGAAKQAPFPETEPGLSTVESVFSLGLGLVQSGDLSLGRLLEALGRGPAEVLGQAVPAIEPGNPADFFLVKPDESWWVAPETLLSAGKHAPVLYDNLPGVVSCTYVGGHCAYSDQKGNA